MTRYSYNTKMEDLSLCHERAKLSSFLPAITNYRHSPSGRNRKADAMKFKHEERLELVVNASFFEKPSGCMRLFQCCTSVFLFFFWAIGVYLTHIRYVPGYYSIRFAILIKAYFVLSCTHILLCLAVQYKHETYVGLLTQDVQIRPLYAFMQILSLSFVVWFSAG